MRAGSPFGLRGQSPLSESRRMLHLPPAVFQVSVLSRVVVGESDSFPYRHFLEKSLQKPESLRRDLVQWRRVQRLAPVVDEHHQGCSSAAWGQADAIVLGVAARVGDQAQLALDEFVAPGWAGLRVVGGHGL